MTFMLLLILLLIQGSTVVLSVGGLHHAHWKLRSDESLRTLPLTLWELYRKLLAQNRRPFVFAAILACLPLLLLLVSPWLGAGTPKPLMLLTTFGVLYNPPLIMAGLAGLFIPRVRNGALLMLGTILCGYTLWILLSVAMMFLLPEWMIQHTTTTRSVSPTGAVTDMTNSIFVQPITMIPLAMSLALLSWIIIIRSGARWFRLEGSSS